MEKVDGFLNIYRLADESKTLGKANELQETVAGFFGGNSAESWMLGTTADAITAMDAAGVEKAVISASANQGDIWGAPMGIEDAIKANEMYPNRFKLAYYITDLSNPTAVSRRVRALAESGDIAMVATVPSMYGIDINDRRWYPLYAVCEELQLPVRINIGIFGPRVSSRPQDPMMLEDIMLDLPDLTVIGAHMGHPWEALVMRLMMKFDRLYLMTSAYLAKYFDPEVVKFMGSSRGIGRVLWGSDYPMMPPVKSLASVDELPLSEPAKEAYLGGSLGTILGWK